MSLSLHLTGRLILSADVNIYVSITHMPARFIGDVLKTSESCHLSSPFCVSSKVFARNRIVHVTVTVIIIIILNHVELLLMNVLCYG